MTKTESTYSLPPDFNINKIGASSAGTSYQEALEERVNETFEKHRNTLMALAVVSLPIFFIAWPIGYLAANELFEIEARREIKGTLINKRFDFILEFSKELAKDPNKNPEELFDDFIKGSDYDKIFPKNQNKLEIISFARKLENKNFKNSFFSEKDSITLWKKFKQDFGFDNNGKMIGEYKKIITCARLC